MRWTCVLILVSYPAFACADQFDQYTSRDLAKAIESKDVKAVTELTPSMLVERSAVLPRTEGAFVIVKTNDGRLAKLLVQAGRQRIGDESVPMLLVERFVTFQEGTERAVQAAGRDVRVFAGFQYSFDLGQVVPEKIGGEVLVQSTGGKLSVLALGRTKLYLVLKAPPSSAPASERPIVGETFETRFFNGRYKLHDDGRRSGTLVLQVDDSGTVTGSYTSDKDGRKYDVEGKTGAARHAIAFTIKFPATKQSFQGHLFTGDANAIAGTTKLQEREAGFYAVRIE